MKIDPYDPIFGHAEAAVTTGVGPGTLTNWSNRAIVVPTVAGDGQRRRYSMVDLVRLALVAELVNFGLPPGKAGVIAKDAVRDFPADPDQSFKVTLAITRAPNGSVVVDPETGEESAWQCVRFVGDVGGVPFQRMTSGVSPALFVPVSAVAGRVYRACWRLIANEVGR